MKDNKNTMVYKSNDFILNSKYNMTIMEIKLMALLITKLDIDDEEFFTLSFTMNEFKTKLGIKEVKRSYMSNLIRLLRSRSFIIEENGVDTILGFIDGGRVDKNTIEIRFNDDMKKYILQLKNNFTSYELDEIIKFNSVYTFRIWELIKLKLLRYRAYGNENNLLYETSVEDLKILLGVEEKYKRYYNFKQRVLEVVKKELEEHNIQLHYQEIKDGKKVVGLRIFPQESLEEYDNNDKKMFIKRLRELCYGDTIFRTLIDDKEVLLSISKDGFLYNKKDTNYRISKENAIIWYEWFFNHKDLLSNVVKKKMGIIKEINNLPKM